MRTFDPYDCIRIVNLPERTDRRRDMDRELAKAGLTGDPRVAYFSAIKPDNSGTFTSIGARGVYESQKQILREASSSGQSVLILEDDCSFVTDIANWEVGDDWDIFYGGYMAADPANLQESDIIGAHMMGFSAKGAELVHNYLRDLRYEGIHPPIDAAYIWFRREFPTVTTKFARPPLAYQRPSRSDIADLAWYDRTPLVRDLANMLRAARHNL